MASCSVKPSWICSTYSKIWKQVNTTPRLTVITSALNAVFWSSSRMAWWAQVTVAPESSRIRVLRNGMPQVGTGSIPSGGQDVAKVAGGLSAPQKNAQKKAKKKNTSEV